MTRAIRPSRAVFGVAGGALLAACVGASVAAPREAAMVAVGIAVDGSGAPIDRAVITVQTMWPGREGGRFGCTGSYLVGHWAVTTTADGQFGLDLRLTTPTAPICVVVFGALSGDAALRDTASVLTPFTVVAADVAPDTVRFELRLARWAWRRGPNGPNVRALVRRMVREPTN